ncbi:hypothetical protein BT67DRAFT_237226 [Trichocladium antarcticum]|uniref:Uncharacterized protein n=1 Tax=Trichocladium antarcticum TaxID=1450529 RepID=A0AAN6ZFB3_9PEZI|nr:hypothetical protein BT67DRAFT_237226 [Trichocladium antarcticum]
MFQPSKTWRTRTYPRNRRATSHLQATTHLSISVPGSTDKLPPFPQSLATEQRLYQDPGPWFPCRALWLESDTVPPPHCTLFSILPWPLSKLSVARPLPVHPWMHTSSSRDRRPFQDLSRLPPTSWKPWALICSPPTGGPSRLGVVRREIGTAVETHGTW